MAERAKVLIVDDEPFNVDYLEQELEDLDCEADSAQNGREVQRGLAEFNATHDSPLNHPGLWHVGRHFHY